ncbi:MAG: tRNA dihydrouridine synthase DusB [Candidatus Omnitrophota bacterium]
MLKIGKLKLHSALILSPMAGVSDLAFRLLNRRFGCELAFVEMINARSLGYRSLKTKAMMATTGKDRPLGVQLLGCEENFILRALDILKQYEFDIIDFNAACPMKKVIRRGEGASLMRNPKKFNQLLKLIVKNSSVPVTAKIRSGWDEGSVNAREVALYAQDAGVAALFIHGRTRAQIYHGRVDYEIIREVKEALDIPVIASGDIFSSELTREMLERTGCDGVAVARGSLGNPWIFKELSAFFKNQKIPQRPVREEIVDIMLRHLELSVKVHGEKNGVVLFRKFFSYYTKGFRKVRPLRERICRLKLKREMIEAIENLRCL